MTENLNCSFCGKPSTDVDKLIAGPAVHICNECVGLCAEIIGSSGPGPLGSASTEATLGRLGALDRAVLGLTADLQRQVDRLRADDVDWSRIADVLAAPEEEVQRRFSPS